ncbi:MAG: copper-binding protein [Phenylobacterium sp.]|uniref:copper-binding protein n=1 Tax=Phenylobacterium sp. TaxID=1871053 RepID=UPI001A587486|nr:copper-binding protein [Phenylobacterium sp.]MBL8556551.1 copper-binding protein [Phenylobacterium sp.]
MKYALSAAILTLASPAFAQHPAHGAAGQPSASAAGPIKAAGVVKSVNPKAGTVKIHHAPIPALKWPAMIMDFKAPPSVIAAARVGRSVTFTLNATGDQVTSLQ